MKDFFANDKNVVIFAVVILAGLSIFFCKDASGIINSALAGLFGVAIGKTL